MDSFKLYLDSLDVAKSTRANHYRNIVKIEEFLLNRTVEDLIDYLKTTISIPSQTKTALRYYAWKKDYVSHGVLMGYYKGVLEEDKIKQQKKTNLIKTQLDEKTIKNKDELFVALEQLYVDGKYKEFVINYLLLRYHVRNLDIDLLITKDKSKLNKTDNFLYLQKKKVTYIRNKYKTVAMYGAKEYVINDKKFLHSVSELLMDERLLQTKNLTQEIKKYTIDRLSETEINKIIIASMNIQEFESISDSRGTSLQVLADSYNPNKLP